jgi:acid phosphatase
MHDIEILDRDGWNQKRAKMVSNRLFIKALRSLIFISLGYSPLAFANVSVSSPANGATVSSPIHFVATATTACSRGVSAMGIYVNNHLSYVVQGSSLNTGLPLSPGTFHTVVQEWDGCGGSTTAPINLIVATSVSGVQVSQPVNNSTVVSPIRFVATATTACSRGVSAMGIYVNNHLSYVVQGSSLNTGLPLSAGTFHTVVQEWDGCGGSTTAPINLIVGTGGSSITSVQATCKPASIAVNSTSQCAATVQGIGSYNSAVTWHANQGSINQNGLFTAPGFSGTATISATTTQDSAKYADTTVTVAYQTPQSRHVILVMEENQDYATVVGNTSSWPYLNHLIADGSLPTNYYANTHPSIGNYFMLTTGQVLTNNDNSTAVWNVDNIARRMLSSGVSFKIYAEGIPNGYVGGNTGPYLIRHNPFAMLSDVANNAAVAQQHIWPFSQFATDLANGTLPEFSFIVPDVNDDAHNGTPLQADSWLQSKVVIPLTNHPAFQPGGDGILFVDFDEGADSDTAHGGGHVAPVLWGPNVRAGYTQSSSIIYQEESVLRTIMEALSLGYPPGAAGSAPSMSEFFVQK